MSMLTNSLSWMWGVIRSVMPTSLRSTELMTLARFVESLDVLVMKGMFSATMISASLLFCVSRWGDERMFRWLFPWDARRTAATAGIFVPSGRVTLPPSPPATSPEPAKVSGFPAASPASRSLSPPVMP